MCEGTDCLRSPFVREMEHAILMWYFEDIKSCEEEVRCDYKYLMNGEELQIENREELINVNNVLGKYCRAAMSIIYT